MLFGTECQWCDSPMEFVGSKPAQADELIRILCPSCGRLHKFGPFSETAEQLLGMDRFEGRTWRGWHRHMAIVLLAYAFLATLRAEMGGGAPLPPLRQVARTLVTEACAQEIVRIHTLEKGEARAIATTMVRYLTDL